MKSDDTENSLNDTEIIDTGTPEDEFWSDLDDERELITIVDDDGNEIELCIIDAILHENINYLLCVETSEADKDSETEAYIFKEVADLDEDSDSMSLMPIEDDEEYCRIIELFQNDDYELVE